MTMPIIACLTAVMIPKLVVSQDTLMQRLVSHGFGGFTPQTNLQGFNKRHEVASLYTSDCNLISEKEIGLMLLCIDAADKARAGYAEEKQKQS